MYLDTYFRLLEVSWNVYRWTGEMKFSTSYLPILDKYVLFAFLDYVKY